ncbi:MAG: SUMF1/EgtB/PvdO family nonheme iron enzyme [Isosphaeraceae bacterium]
MASLARDDPDPGLHSAAFWLLRRWSLDDELAAVRRSLPRGNAPARPGDRWFVNAEGQTFTVVPGPVSFVMGEPMWSSDGERFALPHRVRIERDFAIATAEVTAAEFDRFRIDLAARGITIAWKPRTQFVRDPDGPALAVDFYLAARYCNWLSERAGIPRDQWCFVEKDGTLDLAPDYLQRTGYRLPTEAEWEFACRAGTETPWPIGRGWGGQVPFIDQYSWCLTGYSRNQSRPVGLLKPNDLGLFDMLGNAHEWCLDPKEDYCRGACHRELVDREHPERLSREGKRILRGGWFNFPAEGVSSGHRSWGRALDDDNEIGLRLARTLPRPAVASLP